MTAAGTPFNSADDAAIAALQEILPTSIKANFEYAGRIYQRSNGVFSFTAAQTQNDSNNSSPGPKVPGNVGSYHTHAGGFNDTDEIFSPDDKLKATLAKELSYLGTPHQRILKFTPLDLLSGDQQAANPVGLVEVLVNVWVIPEVTIVGDPNSADDDDADVTGN